MSMHLGIDLGGTNVKYATVEIDGDGARIVEEAEVPTRSIEGPAAVVARLAALAGSEVSRRGDIASVGVGLPGLFDWGRGTTRFLPNLPGDWSDQPFAAPIAEAAGMPVRLINDARAFALAEHRAGAGQGCATMVGITLGTGIGGGIVVDGRLRLGIDGTAGEFGHQTVVPNGPRCGCGRRGCVESVASAGALARAGGKASAKEVIAAAQAGDPWALRAVEEVCAHLSIAIANACVLLCPDRIVIGGGVSRAGETLIGPLRAAVRQRVTVVPIDRIEIVQAQLGSTAGAVGAALWGAGMGA